MDFIRIWSEVDINEVEQKMAIADDIHIFCPGCKKTGIPYNGLDKCPGCGREFKYITTRENPKSVNGSKILNKIINKLPNLKIIDYSDYKHIADKNKAHGLFS